MKYDDLISKIYDIKTKRNIFLKSFTQDPIELKNILLNNKNNKEINSIRLHKFLTVSGELGKVKTARFLESIDLNENTKISELNNKSIESIIEFTEQ